MQNVEKFLPALRVELPDKPHIAAESCSNFGDWAQVGKPHLWQVAEEADSLTVLLDTGYGSLALFDGDQLVATGKTMLIYDGKAVVLDRDSYEVAKYIWR